MNTIDFGDALRSLLDDIGDAAGSPRDFADLPNRMHDGRTRRPGAVAALGLAAAALVALVVISVQRSSNTASDVTQTAAAVTWLDLPATPEGMVQVPNDRLAGFSVCVEARTESAGVVCNGIEGRTEIAYTSATSVGPTFEIQTIFNGVDLEDYIDGLIAGGPPFTRTDLVVRDGRTAVLITGEDDVELLVWQERAGVIGVFRSVDASPEIDVPSLVETLVERSWPADIELPIVAVDLGVAWTTADNNHPYVIASHRGDDECLSIGFAPTDPSTALATCATDALQWTSGSISTGLAVDADNDVVAGWLPEEATAVRLTLADGTDVELPTHAVEGSSRRAWGYLIPADQGTRFSARLTALDTTGSTVAELQIDFVNPVIFAETVCANVDMSGTVPDVIGMPIYAAADVLRAAGLIISQPLRGAPTQTVTSQNPQPGADRRCGDVQLAVSPANG